jgi:hypothetical protein
MVIVTVLANLAVVGALFLGWHLNAFTALQLVSAGVGIAILEVIIIVPYRLWKSDKAEIAGLSERVTSKLRCSFAMNDPGCVRPTIFMHSDGTPLASTLYRIRVEALGSRAINNCSGRLLSVRRQDREWLLNETPMLPFAPHEQPDALLKTIYPDVPVYLDLLTAQERNGIGPMFRGALSSAVEWKKLFRERDEYFLRIAIVSPDSPTATINLRFDWTLDPKTSTMLSIS